MACHAIILPLCPRERGGQVGLPVPVELHPHTAVDGHPLAVELLLVVGHDPADPPGVEVSGHLLQGEVRLGKLEEGPLEEIPVVRLEVDLPPVSEHPPVPLQKVRMGQPPPGVAVGGPGITEVDVDPLHLVGGEVVPEIGHVGVQKPHVLQAHGLGPLHGDDHGVGHPLHRHKKRLRRRRRRLAGEAPLAAAQLQVQRPLPAQQAPPLPTPRRRVLDLIRPAALHPGDEVGFLSHSHPGRSSLCLQISQDSVSQPGGIVNGPARPFVRPPPNQPLTAGEGTGYYYGKYSIRQAPSGPVCREGWL